MEIAVDGLVKRFGEVEALRGVSLAARAGRVLGFLGPNGSGKSTTLRCLLGYVQADDGSASFSGRRYAQLEDPIRVVGSLIDPEAHHPDRSGRDHLRVLCDAAGLATGRADEVLDVVELTSAGGRRAGGYSLGMRQRLHLGAALLGDPPVLVLDEPTNGLDPQGVRWLRDFLRLLAAEGRTVLLSSHVLSEVRQTVDDVAIVAGGRTRAAGPLLEVLGSESELRVRAADLRALADLAAERAVAARRGDAGDLYVRGVDAASFAHAAHDRGLVLTLLEEHQPDLEHRYFALTDAAS